MNGVLGTPYGEVHDTKCGGRQFKMSLRRRNYGIAWCR
jgi:hypothetical protein